MAIVNFTMMDSLDWRELVIVSKADPMLSLHEKITARERKVGFVNIPAIRSKILQMLM